MEFAEYESWVATQRKNVESYLRHHGIDNPAVGPWPAFDMAPYFAIWAVESKTVAGRIGWWAFSGDCPTDYITAQGRVHPRNALRILLGNWRSYIPYMKRGEQPPNTRYGDGSNLVTLGELLETRVEIFEEWLADDGLWEDR